MIRFALAAALTVLAAPTFAGAAKTVSGYVLTDDGTSLLVMNNISKAHKAKSLTLAKAVSAIAWRPVTGQLLGFTDGAIYSIDTESGEMSSLDASFAEGTMIKGNASVAFDFNNKIDAVRAVTSYGDNLVYFPEGFGDNDERAGSVRRFTSLAYGEGDSMEGKAPAVFANAYTNALNGKKASDTFQYAIDANTDALVSLANNAGTLTTIGQITVDGLAVNVMPKGGFDIVSTSEGDDAAYAVLKLAGAKSSALFSINLETGEAERLAEVSDTAIGFAASIAG